jgi:hypothetical protein
MTAGKLPQKNAKDAKEESKKTNKIYLTLCGPDLGIVFFCALCVLLWPSILVLSLCGAHRS